jgi:hypothetical protein
MVDEDFVMGYAVGYNDGVGSGGGDVPTGDTVIYKDVTIAKQWNLAGTPFAIALFDVHSDRLICGVNSVRVSTAREKWDRCFVYYWVAMGLIYNGDIVTVNPLESVSDGLVLNGTPYLQEFSTVIKSVGGDAVLNHTSTTSSSGVVTHTFLVTITPTVTAHNTTYYHNEIIAEGDKTAELGSSSVLSWRFTVSADGTKQMSAYDPYWFFYPTKNNGASYIEKGTLGVPKGTSTQQLLQTGLLAETLKESLLNAGDSITLEEV